MLKVLFFARIREQLDCDEVALEWQPELDSFSGLEQALIAQHGPDWSAVFAEDNLLRAQNQSVVSPDTPISDGDEIAYFPPVTGG